MACFMRFNKLCITNGFTSYVSGDVYALFRFLYVCIVEHIMWHFGVCLYVLS